MDEKTDTSFLAVAVGSNAEVVRWFTLLTEAKQVAERISLTDPAWVIEDHRGDGIEDFAVVKGTFDPDLIPQWATVVWHADPEVWE